MAHSSSNRPRRLGRVARSGDTLWISFPYSKKRFERIKRIRRASYNKAQRRWELPLLELPRLQATEQFGPGEITYDLDVAETKERLETLQKERQVAEERRSRNPFFVSRRDISLLDPEVVVQLGRDGAGVEVRLRPYSTLTRLLETFPGVVYTSQRRSFRFPAEQLAELLKKLRDANHDFAVEEHCGQRLQAGTTLRNKVIAGTLLRAAQLADALLYPYLMLLDDGSDFAIRGALPEELRIFFPGSESSSLRRASRSRIDASQAAEALYFASQARIRLWPAQEAAEQLIRWGEDLFASASSEGFPQSLSSVVQLKEAWLSDAERRAGVYVSDCVFSEIPTAAKRALPKGVVWLRQSSGLSHGHFAGVSNHRVPELRDWAQKHLPAGEAIPLSKECADVFQEVEAQAVLRRRQQEFQEMTDAELPEVPAALREQLYPHQRVAIAWMLERREAFLGDDMGLGKTLSVLALTAALRLQEELDFLLVVCPNSLVRNWQREAEQWTPGQKLLALPANKGKRQKFLHKVERYSVDWIAGMAINFESFRLDDVVPVLRKICSERRTLLCIDESQRAKNPQSKTFAALAEIAAVCERRVLLSGTPTPKDVTDIWAQMKLLDGGERLGGNYYRWLEEVAELGNKWSEYAVKKFRPEKVQETISRVHEVLLRRKKEDVLALPDKIFTVRDLVLKGDQKKRYEEVRKALLLRVSTSDGKTYMREIDSILEEFLRAVQIASNPRLIDETWSGEPVKFLELDEIVAEVVGEKDEKLVIWTNYRRNAAELAERYASFGSAAFTGDTATDERADIIDRFQNGSDLNIVVAIPAAGGVGITLTAAQTAVYVDKTWNAEHWLQSVDRLHRIGQAGTVHILSLHACLVDDIIYKNLRRKQSQQARLLGDTSEAGEVTPSRTELLEAVQH